jgi:hypothetical protein
LAPLSSSSPSVATRGATDVPGLTRPPLASEFIGVGAADCCDLSLGMSIFLKASWEGRRKGEDGCVWVDGERASELRHGPTTDDGSPPSRAARVSCLLLACCLLLLPSSLHLIPHQSFLVLKLDPSRTTFLSLVLATVLLAQERPFAGSSRSRNFSGHTAWPSRPSPSARAQPSSFAKRR